MQAFVHDREYQTMDQMYNLVHDADHEELETMVPPRGDVIVNGLGRVGGGADR